MSGKRIFRGHGTVHFLGQKKKGRDAHPCHTMALKTRSHVRGRNSITRKTPEGFFFEFLTSIAARFHVTFLLFFLSRLGVYPLEASLFFSLFFFFSFFFFFPPFFFLFFSFLILFLFLSFLTKLKKLWLVGVATDRNARHAGLRFFFFASTKKYKKKNIPKTAQKMFFYKKCHKKSCSNGHQKLKIKKKKTKPWTLKVATDIPSERRPHAYPCGPGASVNDSILGFDNLQRR